MTIVFVQLCTANEQLEKEVSDLKKGQASRDVIVGGGTSDTQSEIRRLQAENTALQKNLASKPHIITTKPKILF